jgi:hypothetical protein
VFITRLVNKNTKIVLLKQEKYIRLLTLFCCKSKEKTIYYTFFYQNFVFEQASNTYLKLFAKTSSTKQYIFFRDNIIK